MKRILLVFVVGAVMCFPQCISAQDIHFSQFYMSPINLNPGMTGVMNGDQRIVANVRNQWAAVLGANAYNTFSVSYDSRIPVGRDDYFGFGGKIWADVAGSTRFGTRQLSVAFAYTRKMGGNRKIGHYLSAGAEAGYSQRSINQSDLRWPTQVSNGVFDPAAGPSETIPNSSFSYPDFNGGLVWFSNLGDRKNIYGGASLHHLNQARVSFLGRDERLHSRVTVHAGAEYPLNNKVSVKPDFILMKQGPHQEINAGASFRMKTRSSRTNAGYRSDTGGQFFQLGAWMRMAKSVASSLQSDALILMARLEQERYSFGLSYDYNVSALSNGATANGSFELSAQYLISGSSSRGVYCPTF